MTRSFLLPVVSLAVLAGLGFPKVAFADEPDLPTNAAEPSDVTPAPAPAPEPQTGERAPAARDPDAPIVELSADDERAYIERRMTTTSPSVPLLETGALSVGQWEHACVAPCQLRLDSRYAYRVAGDGLVPSGSFVLPRGQDHVRVDAKMGSSAGRVVGALAAAGGVLSMAGGGLALAATPILESEDIGSKGFRTGVLAGGIGALSVGAVSAAVGLFLWLSNGSSARAEGAYSRHASRR